MKIKEWKQCLPEIMRVLRILLLVFLTFEYPAAGKCLLLVICVEIAVGKGRYAKGIAIFLNILIIYLSVFSGHSYFKVNVFIYLCNVAYFLQLFIEVGNVALQKVDFLRENKEITGDIVIKIRYVLLAVVVFVSAEFGLAVWPYKEVEEVSDEYRGLFDIEKFYSDKVSSDRAMILDDNGDALKYRISLIENAKIEICMSVFSFQTDTSGKQMLASLTEAAKRGVKIRILMDGFNYLSDMKGNPYFMVLAREDNVEFKVYNEVSLFTPWNSMSRMHEKYMIVDNETYILGDRNICDAFLGVQEGSSNNRDVLVYNGGGTDSSIYELRQYFEGMWIETECEEWDAYLLSGLLPSVHSAKSDLEEVYKQMKEDNEEWFEKQDYVKLTVPTDKITLLSNPTDAGVKEPLILYNLTQLMENAKEKIMIHTPFIVADSNMYEMLRNACDNATVTLTTNSPYVGDNLFGTVDYVLNKGDILNTGVHLFEYVGETSYEANSIIIDDDISIIGSFNMDYKSAYHDTELMLVIDSEEFNDKLEVSHFTYEKKTIQAEVVDNEINILLNGKSLGEMLEGSIIKMLSPHFRYLF